MFARRLATALFVCLFSAVSTFAATEPVADAVPSTDAGQRVAVLVELHEPAAAETYAATLATHGARPGRVARGIATDAAKFAAVEAARAQIRRNVAAQARVRPRLLSVASDARTIYQVQRVANAIALEVSRGDIPNLRKVEGVRRVTIIDTEYPNTSTSVPHLNTTPVWGDAIGRSIAADGTGVSLGVIDTGIDYQHATFGGTGASADYTANNRTVAPDAYFPTAKVIGGHDFAGDNYNGTAATIAADPDPMDCNGHGTHVASIAAGFGVNADGTPYAGAYDGTTPFSAMRIGPGTAPRASLYAIRVFGCGGGTNLTVQGIDWAVDPNGDSDLSDHLDVINMSLGSSFGRLASATAIAADNAAKMGVIVVVSAGNSGDTYFISGSPGSGTRVLTTAGTQDPGLPGNAVRVNAPAGIAGTYTAAGSAFGPPPPGSITGNVVLALDPADGAGPLTTDACSPLTNAAAVNGNIALVDRGTCGFTVKVKNAQDAGAIAVLIANSAAGVFGTPGGSDPTITIPSVMITFADGNTFKANLATLNVTLFDGSNTLYPSSSRGARGGVPVALKPDIAAPGLNITAAQSGVVCTGTAPSTGCIVANASGFIPNSQTLTISGTSMAAPHMAGIMALLRQIHPDWSVEELKAAAMNGAHHDITTLAGGNGVRYAPGRVGAGRTDAVLSASTDVVAFDDEVAGAVSVSFDLDGVVGSAMDVRTVRIVNRGATGVTYDLATDIIADVPGISISFPGGSQVTVPANSSVTFDVQVTANASLMDHVREASVSPTQTAPASPASVASLGALNRHWLSEESGYITLSAGGDLKLRIPVHVNSAPASAMAASDVLPTGGSPTGSTTLPLSGSDVCTGTLGAGPTCTGSFPNDEVSIVTPFELQVASPMDPSNATPWTDLQYAGVAYSAATDQMLFGVSMWEPWSTPTDTVVNIFVDCGVYTNGANFAADTCNGVPDGTWDLILFNTNPGSLSLIFGVNTSQQDSFLTAVFVRTRSSVVFGPVNYLNRLSAGAADTRVFNNQVMFLPADRTRLKINSGTGAFTWFVRTCPGSSPLCTALNGFWYDEAPGPFAWNYLAANQGLDFGGANLLFDLNGASVPVTWNTANLTANGSLGGLLLHHHNERGSRAETFVLPGASTTDVGVTIGVSPASPNYGDSVTLTITATNAGPDPSSPLVAITLPAGLTYVSDDGAGAFDAAGLWTVGSLAASGSASLQIVATLDTTDPATVQAIASVATPLDLNLANNEATLTLQAPRSADLALAMSVSSPTVLAGDDVTYTITATNAGDDSSYSISVSESFPSFPALNPSSFTASHGSYNPASGIWNVVGLASGATATLDLVVTTPNMIGALMDTASANADTDDPQPANNTASATTMVLSPAVLTATKSFSTDQYPGDEVAFTIVLENTSDYDQFDNPGDELTDVLSAPLQLINASASSGTAVANLVGNTLTWNGVVPAHSTVTITFTATIHGAAVAGTTVTNTAAFAYDADGNGTNEAAGSSNEAAFTILSPSLLTATKGVATAGYPGAAVTYTIDIENNGPAKQLDNAGDEFTDVLPAGLTGVTASASNGVATVIGNTVTWNGVVFGNPTNTIITIHATVDTVPAGTVLSNQATLSYDADGNLTNEASAVSNTASFTVVSPASLTSPSKSVSGTGAPGSTVTYTIVLSNTGAAAQLDNPGDELVDVLPSSLTLVSANATSGTAVATIATNTVTWNGSIPPSGTVTITIQATIDPSVAFGTTISNQATVHYDSDGNGTNDASAVTNDPATTASGDATVIVVSSPASIASASKTVLGNSGIIRYTIEFTNTGAATQLDNPGDEMVDVLPAELELLSASASSGAAAIAGNTVTWNGSINVNQTVTVTIYARIAAGTPPGTEISNQATIHFDADGNGTNESNVQTNVAAFATAIAEIPTASTFGLMLLGALIAAAALVVLKR